MARLTSLLILVAALPIAFATQTASESSCSSSEFFYDAKECCVPQGGIPNPPQPPEGNDQCPTSGWYWHSQKECCVPTAPPTPSSPPPQCGGGRSWNEGSSTCCEGGGTTTTSVAPTPSANPFGSRSNSWHSKRAQQSRRSVYCPDKMEACPISGLTGPAGDFECIDPMAELESCGGCASTGEGQNCAAIEGAWNVACEVGRCAIYTCADGYKLAADGSSCLPV